MGPFLTASIQVEEEAASHTSSVSRGGSRWSGDRDRGDDGPLVMSEVEANKQIAEDIKEFFSSHDIDESEYYFTKLPMEHRHRLVGKMVSRAIESKEADGRLVADAFARAAEKKLCSISTFEEGLLPVAELLDEIVIDAPKAFQIMATVMKGAGLDKGREPQLQTGIAHKSASDGKLLDLLCRRHSNLLRSDKPLSFFPPFIRRGQQA